ncbi:zinc-binding metallopeptidase family protein [Clostridium sp. DL1XJH146]
MKQKAITYLSTLDSMIYKILSGLYSFNERGYQEYKSYSFITDIFKENNFRVDEHIYGINTAFKAEFGNNYPTIALICEYDSYDPFGHILGTNVLNAVSICASMAITKIIPSIGGKVQVYGCPGESVSGSKAILAKLGAFEDVDAVISFQPHNFNAQNGTSPATLPIEIKLEFIDELQIFDSPSYLWYDIINSIQNLFNRSDDICIDKLNIQGSLNPKIKNTETIIDFTIKASSLDKAYEYKKKLCELLTKLSTSLNFSFNLNLSGVPYHSLKINETLSRIFVHNMKENGIINVENKKDFTYGLSLGNISTLIPTIKPFIKIGNPELFPFATEEFSKLTLKKDTITCVKNIASSICCTFIDLVEKETLLEEAKIESNKS